MSQPTSCCGFYYHSCQRPLTLALAFAITFECGCGAGNSYKASLDALERDIQQHNCTGALEECDRLSQNPAIDQNRLQELRKYCSSENWSRAAAIVKEFQGIATFDLHIIANRHDHPKCTELVSVESVPSEFEVDGGVPEWLAVASQGMVITDLGNSSDAFFRIDPSGVDQILVITRRFDISNEDIAEAYSQSDYMGRNIIHLPLNPTGIRKMGRMASEYAPERPSNFHRHAAICLSGKVVSAPQISGNSGTQIIINAGFSAHDAERIAAMLNAWHK